MYCKQCGAQINDNAKFCGVCGTPVQESIAAVKRGRCVDLMPGGFQDESFQRVMLRRQAEQDVAEARNYMAYINNLYSEVCDRIKLMKTLGVVTFFGTSIVFYYMLFTIPPVEGNIISQLVVFLSPLVEGLIAMVMVWGFFAVGEWVRNNGFFASLNFLFIIIFFTVLFVAAFAAGGPYFDKKKKEADQLKRQLSWAQGNLTEKESVLNQVVTA